MVHSSPLASIQIISLAALTCGILDIACTLTLSKLKGIMPVRLLQAITSALIGPKSFNGGATTAAVGMGIHFFIAFTAAAVYYTASLKLSALIDHAVLCGLLYGIAVHLFMTFIVLPLSALRRPFSAKAFVTQLIVHMVCVGLPIALVVSHFRAPTL
jgi:uncharacterized membrane protein YagU involved in acid resistance